MQPSHNKKKHFFSINSVQIRPRLWRPGDGATRKEIVTCQRCTESEIFHSDSVTASAEYTPTLLLLRNILKVWTPIPA